MDYTHLLKCSANKDIKAFKSLFDKTYGVLFGVAINIVRDHHIAEEIVQEAFLKIWLRAETFNEEKSLALTWMCVIARNTALDKLRKKKSRLHFIDCEDYIMDSHCYTRLTPEVLMTYCSDIKEYAQSLKGLPPLCIKSLLFFNYYGYTHSEISSQLGVPLGTVKSWIQRNPRIKS